MDHVKKTLNNVNGFITENINILDIVSKVNEIVDWINFISGHDERNNRLTDDPRVLFDYRMLIQYCKRWGIETDGKSRSQLEKELYDKISRSMEGRW